MPPCPAVPDHRCLDCAPTRGRVFSTAGLRPGNPLEPRDPGPAVRDPAAFAGHFERVEVPRGTNRDGLVRITQPARPGTKRAKTPKRASRPKLAIPVIFHRS